MAKSSTTVISVDSDKKTISYDQGRAQIVSATSFDELKGLRSKAEALRRYWLQRKDKQMEACLAAIRLRADYEIGVRSKALHSQPGSLPSAKRSVKLATLAAAGIPFQRAAENEKLVDILSAAEIDRLCRHAVEQQEVVGSTKSYLFRVRMEDARREFQSIKSQLPSALHVGDFRNLAQTIPDASVDLVFIDPPYDEGAIPLYAEAARTASRILRDGGSLISFCGHFILPSVLPLMMEHLKYFWIGAAVHGSPQNTWATMSYFGIIVGFKPLLWFIKGNNRTDIQTLVCDTVINPQPEKDFHDWQQGMIIAENFISKLVSANGTVVDFFAGGGTTIMAARKLNRSWIAFEIDEIAANSIYRRLSEESGGRDH